MAMHFLKKAPFDLGSCGTAPHSPVFAIDGFHEAKMLLRKAVTCTKDAAYLCHRSTRLHLRAVTLNNMGCFCKRSGKLDAALEYLQKALRIETKLGGSENPAGTHLNICAVLSLLRRHEDALRHAKVYPPWVRHHAPHSLCA